MLRSFPWTDTAPKAPRTSLSCISGRPRAPTRVFQPRPAGPRRWLVSRAGGETVEHGQKYHSRAPKKTLRGRWWDLGNSRAGDSPSEKLFHPYTHARCRTCISALVVLQDGVSMKQLQVPRIPFAAARSSGARHPTAG